MSIKRLQLWLLPGMGVKRFVALAMLGTLILIIGTIFMMLWVMQGERQVISDPIEQVLISKAWLRWGGFISGIILATGIAMTAKAIIALNRSLLSNWVNADQDVAALIYRRVQLERGPKIVAMGGGTGLSNLLRGLRRYSSNITAVVAVSDDGGSSGRLRADFNMPAPGDLVDCLAALSDDELHVSRLLEYRFQRGEDLKGHTFGNLFVTTLTEVEKDFAQAMRVMNNLLNICGAVYPITGQPILLKAQKLSGVWIDGESNVARLPGGVRRISIEPSNPPILPEVVSALAKADLIVLGPGSLFTSIMPNIVVPESRKALLRSTAPIVYVCNIMTEAGETDDFSVLDHVEAIYQHLGRYPDWVMVNSSAIAPELLSAYQQENAIVVPYTEEAFKEKGIRVAYQDLLNHDSSYAQHDPHKLASWLNACAKGNLK